MVLELGIFFVCGILEDVLATAYNLSTEAKNKLGATVSSVGLTLFGILILGMILDSMSFGSINDAILNPRLWGYVMGNVVGVNVAMNWKEWMRKLTLTKGKTVITPEGELAESKVIGY